MPDSCDCINIKVNVSLKEPKLNGKLDPKCETILCSDGEDYKRGYDDGHAQGLIDGRADGYESGYKEGHKVGSETGYQTGKNEGLTEGYGNGYAQGNAVGYKAGYDEGYQKGYSEGYEKGLADGTKEEQEKYVKITENGTQVITPDENKVLSKVTVEVNVKGEEFIGVKYSDFIKVIDGYLPTVADASSLTKALVDYNSKNCVCVGLFASRQANTNLNFSAQLRTIYVPSGAESIDKMFYGCRNLTTIIGDMTSVLNIGERTFNECYKLTELPYMPNLSQIGMYAFNKCTGLSSITFYKVLAFWDSTALQGCINVKTINLVDGWDRAVYVQHCTNLTQECLHDMCEKLADMTGKTALVFKVGADNIAKIDDEHIAMLQQKNIDYS